VFTRISESWQPLSDKRWRTRSFKLRVISLGAFSNEGRTTQRHREAACLSSRETKTGIQLAFMGLLPMLTAVTSSHFSFQLPG